MPELPEVEFAATRLRHAVAGRVIARLEALHPSQQKSLPEAARGASAACRDSTPCWRCRRAPRRESLRWISCQSWAADMSRMFGTFWSSRARRASDIAARYSPSHALASRASGVASICTFAEIESRRYSSSYDDIPATRSLNWSLMRRTSVGV